ncbi:hypothetical protein GQ54DRAFT_254190 [Martensiomyces pterosporus]|nr:hypothetical protein GQ54DRAFT_254190 [Martensiomyces pterosporus]
MPRKEFPGDPRRTASIVPYTSAVTSEDGGLYYMIAFLSSMAALFLRSKWIGWVALFSSMLSIFTDRASATGANGGRLSTLTFALMALVMTYMPEMVALYNLFKGDVPEKA